MFVRRSPRAISSSVACLAALGLLVALSGATPTLAQSAEVGGRLVDQEGNGLVGRTLRFTSEDGTESKIKTKKKGRFFGRLRQGVFTVALVDPELFILKAGFQMRNPQGLTLGKGELDGDPANGVRGVQLSDRNEVTLELVAASRGSAAARERRLAVALPELAAAADAYNAGDYEQAITRTEALLAENPELGEAYYVQALSLEKLGRYAGAETALRQAVERIPEHPSIWGILGEVTLELADEYDAAGNAQEARAAFARAVDPLERAIEADPESAPLRQALAATLDRSGDPAHAAKLASALEAVVDTDPTNQEARLRLAGLYSKQGRQEDAMEVLRQIPETEKSAAVTMYNIAVRLNEEGNSDAALVVARRATEIDDTIPNPWQLIAQILLARNERPEAAEAIRKFLELAPEGAAADSYRRILEQIE